MPLNDFENLIVPGTFPPEQQSYPLQPSVIPQPPQAFPSPTGTPDDPDKIQPATLGVPTGQVFYQTSSGQQGNAPPVGVWVPYFQGNGYLSTFISMKEYAGSGKVSYNRSGWKGTRIFEVPWFQWMDFGNALLGYSVNQSGGVPTYYLPDVFSAGMPWMFCRELEVEGIEGLIRGYDADPLTPRIYYERAKITATYMPLDMDVTLNVSGQILSVPSTQLAWLGTDIRKGLQDVYGTTNPSAYTTLAEDVGKIIPGGEFSLTRHYLPAPYFAPIAQIIGAVNSTSFLGFQPSTLLVVGMEARRTWTLNGAPVWDIVFKTSFQPNSWLSLYNGNPDGKAGTTQPGYQYVRSLATPAAMSQTQPSPPLLWTDGSQIGPYTNNVGIAVNDYGFIYALADFTPLLYFL